MDMFLEIRTATDSLMQLFTGVSATKRQLYQLPFTG